MANLISNRDSRIYYKVKDIFVNGSLITNITEVKFTTFFNLCQCYCSCSLYVDSNLIKEQHYEDCFCAKGLKKIGYIDNNGKEVYF